MNGANVHEGRIEVCIQGTWMTVCDQYWYTDYDYGPEVVCAQLGYSREGE